jgi:hypothetical protein
LSKYFLGIKSWCKIYIRLYPDPDDPDPIKNVRDLQHCFQPITRRRWKCDLPVENMILPGLRIRTPWLVGREYYRALEEKSVPYNSFAKKSAVTRWLYSANSWIMGLNFFTFSYLTYCIVFYQSTALLSYVTYYFNLF